MNLDLLVVGNGFDLACGKETSYNDFHSAMVASIESKEMKPTEYLSIFPKRKFDDERIELFFSESKKMYKSGNFFVNYFYHCSDAFEWNRVEKEISKIVRFYDYILSSMETCSNSIGGQCYIDTSPVSDCLNIISNISKFHFHKLEYGITYKGNVPDLRRIIGVKNCSYRKDQDEFLQVQKIIDDVPKRLLTNLFDFSKLFSLYLKTFCNQKSEKQFHDLSFSKVINYNYTDTLESSFKIKDENICHIHGKLKDDNGVFGIEPCVFRIPTFNLFSKPSLGLLYDTGFKNFDNFLSFGGAEKKCHNIGFFGHSFDLADSYTLKHVFDLNKNNILYIYYKDANSKRDLISNLVQLLGNDEYSNRVSKGKINFTESTSVFY